MSIDTTLRGFISKIEIVNINWDGIQIPQLSLDITCDEPTEVNSPYQKVWLPIQMKDKYHFYVGQRVNFHTALVWREVDA